MLEERAKPFRQVNQAKFIHLGQNLLKKCQKIGIYLDAD